MFIADPIERTPGAGLLRGFDPNSARLQVQISTALFLVLTLAAVASCLMAGADLTLTDEFTHLAKRSGAHIAEASLDIRS